jgi:ubiquinone/menaquinone biosynthesis C-methylase UbiE
MAGDKEYVLGTDEAEYQRLGFQHQLWSDLAHRAWMHAGIAPGLTVLDVGCGPGFAAMDLAAIVGVTGRVIAVDESAGFVDRLRAEASARHAASIEAHVCDVQSLESLPIVPGTVDLAYARWVLCFVADPAAVVRGVARLLKPGGRFCVNDYFNYETMTIAPRSAAFSRGIAAVGKSWRNRGGDPDIVGRLPRLAADAGMRVLRLDVEQRLARPHDSMWQWPESFWKNYIPRLVQSNDLSQREADEFMAAWRAFSNDPAGFMVLPAVYELIVEKA